MKKDKTKLLERILSRSKTWISSGELASMLNVSTKTIRNYIKEMDNIESSSKGYRLRKQAEPKSVKNDETGKRIDQILSILLQNRDGISAFDLSEMLYVSEGTISADVQHLRNLLSPFHIQISGSGFVYRIHGEEQKIRKLIGWITTHGNRDWFTSTDTLQQLSPDFDISAMEQFLLQTAGECGLLFNSYAMKNLILHLLIILIRIDHDHPLEKGIIEDTHLEHLLDLSCQKSAIRDFVEKVSEYCFQETGKRLNNQDLQQMTVLTILSGKLFELNTGSLDAFAEFMDPSFFNAIIQIVLKMDDRYNLPHMNNTVLCQFVLHVYNLYWRASTGMSYPNPLLRQIKTEHAPIYDVAIYFCHEFSRKFKVKVSEDEIGFIALHLGSCQGIDEHQHNRIPCLIISEDYYGTSLQLIHELHYSFGEELQVIRMAPYSQIRPEEIEKAELIISSTYFSSSHPNTVFVNPILTRKDLRMIREQIEKTAGQRLRLNVLSFMMTLFQEELYFRNVDAGNSAEEVIRFLCSKAEKNGWAESDFEADVLNRERMSSTAFTDQCAIPHGVAAATAKSFISVLYNDLPINWNGTYVNFVLLIGIREQDMHQFRDVFDLIVSSFTDVEKTIELLRTGTLEQFIEVLISQ